MKFYTSDMCFYEGLSEEVVIALRTELGRSTTFISEEDYLTLVAADRASRGL